MERFSAATKDERESLGAKAETLFVPSLRFLGRITLMNLGLAPASNRVKI